MARGSIPLEAADLIGQIVEANGRALQHTQDSLTRSDMTLLTNLCDALEQIIHVIDGHEVLDRKTAMRYEYASAGVEFLLESARSRVSHTLGLLDAE